MGPDQPRALIAFAEQHQIPIAKDKRGEAPFSGGCQSVAQRQRRQGAGRPGIEVPDYVYSAHHQPEEAPDSATISPWNSRAAMRSRSMGNAVARDLAGTKLNALGKANGIGRLDLVENRFVGMKSRGMYETPGGTILHVAHRGIESITLDRGAAHLKDEPDAEICRADL
jgi:argininosuccinate synthase